MGDANLRGRGVTCLRNAQLLSLRGEVSLRRNAPLAHGLARRLLDFRLRAIDEFQAIRALCLRPALRALTSAARKLAYDATRP